ncbi:MAG: S9 family peptidase [Acidobacteria bacterium]|nr:S9 family peptidase [Acidobacteriota bacterium]
MNRPMRPRPLLALLLIGSSFLGGGTLTADELEARLARIFTAREYAARTFGPARWLDDGRAYTTVEDSAVVGGAKDIVRYDTATGDRSVLVSAGDLVPGAGEAALTVDDYAWSEDGTRLLLFTNTVKVWRRNTRGDYWVLEGGTLRQVGAGFPESTLMFAKLSPDGTRVAYVQTNDLYVESLADGTLTRLTSDGSATSINGTSDWVYEEEFDLRDGFRWSPDGGHIAFWHFDATGIGQFPLVNNTDTTYPVVTWIPYPKVGTTNSAVKVGVVSASGGEVRWVKVPGEDPRAYYLPRMEWVSAGGLLVQQMDRRQQATDLWLADARNGETRRLLHDEDEAWLDIGDEWRWLPGGGELAWVSERDGWRHLWAAPKDGGPTRLLTPGAFDILSLEGMDAERLFFIASPDDAVRRYLYSAPLDGSRAPERVSPADQVGTHAYDISPDGRFAFHTFSTMDQPPVVDLVHLPSHQRVRVLEDNAALAAAVAPLLVPPTEFFQVEIATGVSLDGWMVKPRDLDPSKKYPLLMFVYGEPANVTVTDAWPRREGRLLFHRALAEAGYVVASVDNRGTPAPRGREWRKTVHGAVGVLATEDQTAAVRKLLAERRYLDPERVAAWGWSGGGSMTLNLMFRSPDVYKVGMAVAPVPDQTLYDTVYQERYMGLPEENEEGYRSGSPITFADGLIGDLLIVHGTGDDNVHIQGTERLVNRLIELGKPFDYMAYPNRTHGISEGEGTSLHLYSLLARYLREHLPPGPR